MNPLLSPQQREQFIRDGYTVASDLIAPEIIQSTLDDICQLSGLDPYDKNTWPQHTRAILWDALPLTADCFTDELNGAARELLGDFVQPNLCISPFLDKKGDSPFCKGFAPVLAYPENGEKKFVPNWPEGFHLDGIHFASLWPDKMLLIALIYLTDTTEYGGATTLIPGSHRQIFEYWVNNDKTPSANELMLPLKNPEQIVVPGKAGDVIFMHHLMAHAGTPNHDDHIRFALNANLTRKPDQEYQRKTGAPQEDWTPLDYTLRTDNLSS